MTFLKKAGSLLAKAKSNSGGNTFDGLVDMAKGAIKAHIKLTIFFPIIVPVILFILILTILGTTFHVKLNLMQMVDPNSKVASASGAGVAIYDEQALEEYYEASNAAYESSDTPATDLQGTEYGNVEAFNAHIKATVEKAGYGTRKGVIAAGVSLIGDYIKATGKRIRYDQFRLGGRQWYEGGNNEGIINDDFYLDCSSFAWWALYNGGFNVPTYPYTGAQKSWAISNGYDRTPGQGTGQGGDYLVSDGHIILIIGTYDDGYYCAEEAAWGKGAVISKRDYSGLSGYTLIDMTDYYNDTNNIRR